MAANPLLAPVLVGLGIQDLSMDPVSIPPVKEAIRAVSAADMRGLVDEIMLLHTADQIEAVVSARLEPLVRGLAQKAEREDPAKRKARTQI
jgi:phosphoenolpyruvate-protein kinase (PTS system EI component)